jgi:hypothetical protein
MKYPIIRTREFAFSTNTPIRLPETASAFSRTFAGPVFAGSLLNESTRNSSSHYAKSIRRRQRINNNSCKQPFLNYAIFTIPITTVITVIGGVALILQ